VVVAVLPSYHGLPVRRPRFVVRSSLHDAAVKLAQRINQRYLQSANVGDDLRRFSSA
jgi:hypothetical protein